MCYTAAILQILENYKENFREAVDCLKILQAFSQKILLKRVPYGSFPLIMYNFKAAFFLSKSANGTFKYHESLHIVKNP